MKSLVLMMMMMMMLSVAYSATLPRGGASPVMLRHRSTSSRWSASSPRGEMAMAPQVRYYRGQLAAQMGGSVAADTFFGGFHNFLSLYNLVRFSLPTSLPTYLTHLPTYRFLLVVFY